MRKREIELHIKAQIKELTIQEKTTRELLDKLRLFDNIADFEYFLKCLNCAQKETLNSATAKLEKF